MRVCLRAMVTIVTVNKAAPNQPITITDTTGITSTKYTTGPDKTCFHIRVSRTFTPPPTRRTGTFRTTGPRRNTITDTGKFQSDSPETVEWTTNRKFRDTFRVTTTINISITTLLITGSYFIHTFNNGSWLTE